jgi:DNA-binding TFAR19-related protein (PDSD5 family)
VERRTTSLAGGLVMELDARLLITLGGMLISVITSFIVTRQKCIELEEDSKQMQKHIGELFDSLEKNNISTQVSANKVNVLATILAPENREKLHRSLERMETTIEAHSQEILRLNKMHNGSHPVVKGDSK